MKNQWKKLIACIAIPLLVGGAAALFTKDSMQGFEELNQPDLSPPGWLFPIVWTLLYILMGLASYLVITLEETYRTQIAMTIYGIQLIFNFFWPIIFFNLEMYLTAFIWLVILWILVAILTFVCYRISKPAGYLLIPYLLWVTFAGYLNYSIYLLN